MVPKLEPGIVRILHTRSGSEGSDEVVVAEFDARGVLVSWTRALGFVDAFRLNDDGREIPEPLILRDGSGWLTLTEGYTVGADSIPAADCWRRSFRTVVFSPRPLTSAP